MKKTVLFSFLGTTLDAGKDQNRWKRWRPSVALTQHEDLIINRYEMFSGGRYSNLAKLIASDINLNSPETEITHNKLDFANPWDFEEVYAKLYDFSKEYNFKPDEEEYFFHITTGTHVAQICIFLLTESRHFPAKLLQTSPSKSPEGTYSIIDLDLSKYDKIAGRFAVLEKTGVLFLKSGIDTKNPDFNRLIDTIERVSIKSSDPILLTGPTGSGKSQLAKKIFELKKSRGVLTGNFIEVNCATLRGDFAMSGLFGHKKGSFTGAANDRAGLLKNAHGGLIFLDEVGELTADVQSMLLRAIEDKRFLPVGSDIETDSNFQIICGTNRDLLREVEYGRFREDLLARINLWTFKLPGLSERIEDLEPNIYYELDKFEKENNIRLSFNKEAKDIFLNFAKDKRSLWKGNFRDLNGSVKRMATLSKNARITSEVVNEEILRLKQSWGTEPVSNNDQTDQFIPPETDLFDQIQLKEVIKICKNSKSIADAGRKLYNYSRIKKNALNDSDRLKKYLERFGINGKEIFN